MEPRSDRSSLDSRLASRYTFDSAEGIERPLFGNEERKVRTPRDGMAANGGPERLGESATEKRPPSSASAEGGKGEKAR
jgi:hypothetical protein